MAAQCAQDRGHRFRRAYPRPPIANLTVFEGAGVSYWASPVEAKLCEGEEVALVGGGNSAGQAVVFLAPRVKCLHLIIRGEGLGSLHVALPDRTHRRPAQRVAAYRDGSGRARRRRDDGPDRRGFRAATGAAYLLLRHLFLFIGADPMANGSPAALRSTTRASS